MSNDQEQAQTVPFSDKLLEMLHGAADACNKQWPDSDSPAGTCRTVYMGVKNGLAEVERLKRVLKRTMEERNSAWEQLEQVQAKVQDAMDTLGIDVE